MKFRWRGGSKGFIARSASRAVRRNLYRSGSGTQALGSCGLLLILLIGIPVALLLFPLLFLPLLPIFPFLQEIPVLVIFLMGPIVIGVFALIYLLRITGTQSRTNWLSLKSKKTIQSIKEMSVTKKVFLVSLLLFTVVLYALLFVTILFNMVSK